MISELAASLGVSRSPVREAIIALSQERLVSKSRTEGWVVSEISLQDMIQLSELRELIEVQAGKEGCLKCSTKILDEMELIISQLESITEIEEHLEKNWKVHELIVLSCGKKKFCEVFELIMRNLRWSGYIFMDLVGRREQSALEHRAILRCFKMKDQECVENAIKNHIRSVRNVLASGWVRTPFTNGNRAQHISPESE